jgi:hypothetical protein
MKITVELEIPNYEGDPSELAEELQCAIDRPNLNSETDVLDGVEVLEIHEPSEGLPAVCRRGSVGPENMVLNGSYRFSDQKEILTYVGHNWSGNGFWHQFEKASKPGVVWSEVLGYELELLEEVY